MACADMVILNKVDLVDPNQMLRIKQWLDSRFHRYRLLETSHGRVPLEVLLSVGRFDPDRTLCEAETSDCNSPGCNNRHHRHDRHDHSASFSTWSYETDRPLSLEALREAASKLPANIYRAKGVIRTLDAPRNRTVLQVVGRRMDLSLQGEWGDRTPRSRIVVIGAPGAIEAEALRDRFERCAAGLP
jgi:G3E family GTPase